MIPHWEQEGGHWDRLVLGPYTLPGVWKVTGTLKREIDIKKSGGHDGARIKDEGYEPAQLRLLGRMIHRDDWNDLQGMLQAIHPKRKGAVRDPLDIIHPVTQFAAITSVYVTEIELPDVDDLGIMTITITALEWLPAPKKVKKHTPEPLHAFGVGQGVLRPGVEPVRPFPKVLLTINEQYAAEG